MAQEFMNIGLNLWKAYMNIRNDVNDDDINRWIWMGDIAIRRAQNLERNLSEDEKLKLEVAITLIKIFNYYIVSAMIAFRSMVIL